MSSSEKIAAALERVKSKAYKNIVQASKISRSDRELLLRTHWLQEIVKGWYMLVRPGLSPGDSGAWYANFWDYLNLYLNDRYGSEYCLSAETSLELHVGSNIMPQQVTVIVSKGGVVQQLPFNTSILTYSDPDNIPDEKIDYNHLKIMTLPFALCKVSPSFFQRQPENAEIALRSIRSPSSLSQIILKYNFNRAASRIIGAYDQLGMSEYADSITHDLFIAGIKVNSINPFETKAIFLKRKQFISPYAIRIELMWHKYRDLIIKSFPKPPGLPKNANLYLDSVNELYEYDAYNSLSIEGYFVSEALINKVKNHQWNPELSPEDAEIKNALAARGYYEAFQHVKKSLADILKGKLPGESVARYSAQWYQALFTPCVRANIIKATDLIGYRDDQVFIRNSRHSPPPKEAVLDAMESFFNCLKREESPAVRAILGHYIFVFIHPYMDGNGRVARFIMNAMLASGGYTWTVIEMARRSAYIDALETAHTEGDMKPFVNFIIKEMEITKKYLKRA